MGAYLSLIGRGRGWGGRSLTFPAFRMGAYLRWALIRGWALIRINTVIIVFKCYWLFVTSANLSVKAPVRVRPR